MAPRGASTCTGTKLVRSDASLCFNCSLAFDLALPERQGLLLAIAIELRGRLTLTLPRKQVAIHWRMHDGDQESQDGRLKTNQKIKIEKFV